MVDKFGRYLYFHLHSTFLYNAAIQVEVSMQDADKLAAAFVASDVKLDIVMMGDTTCTSSCAGCAALSHLVRSANTQWTHKQQLLLQQQEADGIVARAASSGSATSQRGPPPYRLVYVPVPEAGAPFWQQMEPLMEQLDVHQEQLQSDDEVRRGAAGSLRV